MLLLVLGPLGRKSFMVIDRGRISVVAVSRDRGGQSFSFLHDQGKRARVNSWNSILADLAFILFVNRCLKVGLEPEKRDLQPRVVRV